MAYMLVNSLDSLNYTKSLTGSSQALDNFNSPDLRTFFVYASRVKYLVQRHKINLDPSVTSLLVSQTAFKDSIFSRLAMVQLSLANCSAVSAIFQNTTRLHSIDLDLGFKTSVSALSNNAACDLLQNVRDSAPELQSLSIRGFASEGLLSMVASLSMLKSLSLRLGHTATVDILVAISTFPLLASLELQAVDVDVEEMTQKWSSSAEIESFPALTTLDVRGSITFIHTLIQNMRSRHLNKLRMDIDPSTHSDHDDSWVALYSAINDKFSDTLHDLAIEYHTEYDNLRLETNVNDTHNATHDTQSISSSPLDEKLDDFLGFDILYPLSNVRNLRRVVFDTSPPLAIRDQDFDRIVKCWPDLEHFELGSLSTLDPSWTPKTTVKSLVTLSQGLRSLQSLVLPIDNSGLNTKEIDSLPKNTGSPLRTISITASKPSARVMIMTCLDQLFPSLIEVEIQPEP